MVKSLYVMIWVDICLRMVQPYLGILTQELLMKLESLFKMNYTFGIEHDKV